MSKVVLYHGTSRQSADAMLAEGWEPRRHGAGSQQGNTSLLYLTTDPENARWYADEKEDGVVLSVAVCVDSLIVDPEDGIADSVAEEMELPHGLPGSLAVRKALPADAFSEWHPAAELKPGA